MILDAVNWCVEIKGQIIDFLVWVEWGKTQVIEFKVVELKYDRFNAWEVNLF